MNWKIFGNVPVLGTFLRNAETPLGRPVAPLAISPKSQPPISQISSIITLRDINFMEYSHINWCELENFWKRSSSRYIFAQRGDTPQPAGDAPCNLPQISTSHIPDFVIHINLFWYMRLPNAYAIDSCRTAHTHTHSKVTAGSLGHLPCRTRVYTHTYGCMKYICKTVQQSTGTITAN